MSTSVWGEGLRRRYVVGVVWFFQSQCSRSHSTIFGQGDHHHPTNGFHTFGDAGTLFSVFWFGRRRGRCACATTVGSGACALRRFTREHIDGMRSAMMWICVHLFGELRVYLVVAKCCTHTRCRVGSLVTLCKNGLSF